MFGKKKNPKSDEKSPAAETLAEERPEGVSPAETAAAGPPFPQENGKSPAAETPSEERPEGIPPAETAAAGHPSPRENGKLPAAPPAKRKKKKLPPGDDGRTIAEMNVEGMPWYNPTMGKVKEEDKPTRKEKRAMIGAGYLAYLPAFIIALLGFTAAVLIIYLWLHGWTF